MATREALSVAWHAPTGTPRGAGRAGRVAEGLVVPRKPGNAGGGKGPWFESDAERGEGMATGESLAGPERVRELQTVLHAKAKEEPERRFHALVDKVWRADFLAEAWRRVRRNGGSAGVDGERWPATGLGGIQTTAPGSTPARGVSGRELLLGSAFHLAKEGDGTGPGLAAWGRVRAAIRW